LQTRDRKGAEFFQMNGGGEGELGGGREEENLSMWKGRRVTSYRGEDHGKGRGGEGKKNVSITVKRWAEPKKKNPPYHTLSGERMGRGGGCSELSLENAGEKSQQGIVKGGRNMIKENRGKRKIQSIFPPPTQAEGGGREPTLSDFREGGKGYDNSQKGGRKKGHFGGTTFLAGGQERGRGLNVP